MMNHITLPMLSGDSIGSMSPGHRQELTTQISGLVTAIRYSNLKQVRALAEFVRAVTSEQ